MREGSLVQGVAKQKVKAILERVAALLRGAEWREKDAARWQGLAKDVAALKEDVGKEYYKEGVAARDLYKRALLLVAEEAALLQSVENRLFATAEIESWHSDTAKLEQLEKVSCIC
jgi:hypothetical protein